MKIRLLILILLTVGCSTEEATTEEKGDPKYKITPTIISSLFGSDVYVPRDLNDCFVELDKMLSLSLRNEMKDSTQEYMLTYHFSLGMWLRNNWGLWGGSRLSDFFYSIGIYHPDDMSGIILDSYWRYLNSQDIKLEDQVKHYQEFWSKQGVTSTNQRNEVFNNKLLGYGALIGLSIIFIYSIF